VCLAMVRMQEDRLACEELVFDARRRLRAA